MNHIPIGADRLFSLSKAKVISKDTDLLGKKRKLLRLTVPDDEDLVMVKVVNSTAEPDGTFNNYMLRVPPTVKTCQEAVAWTFGLPADEYVTTRES